MNSLYDQAPSSAASTSGQFYWCGVHQISGLGRCPRCAEAAQQRETNRVLEARIADLEAELLQLRRRVAELEHARNDGQRAHNVLAKASDDLEDQLGALLWLMDVLLRPPTARQEEG